MSALFVLWWRKEVLPFRCKTRCVCNRASMTRFDFKLLHSVMHDADILMLNIGAWYCLRGCSLHTDEARARAGAAVAAGQGLGCA